MKPFEALTLAEDFRQQRFVATSNRCLRYELLLRRKVLEAELAERRLQAISSLRVFQRLRREARVLLSVQLVRERAACARDAALAHVKLLAARAQLAKLGSPSTEVEP